MNSLFPSLRFTNFNVNSILKWKNVTKILKRRNKTNEMYFQQSHRRKEMNINVVLSIDHFEKTCGLGKNSRALYALKLLKT